MMNILIDKPWIFPASLIALVTAVLVLAIYADDRQREEWMAECIQHEPKYKCVAMWRAGNSSGDFATGMALGIGAGMAGRR